MFLAKPFCGVGRFFGSEAEALECQNSIPYIMAVAVVQVIILIFILSYSIPGTPIYVPILLGIISAYFTAKYMPLGPISQFRADEQLIMDKMSTGMSRDAAKRTIVELENASRYRPNVRTGHIGNFYW